MDKKKWKELSYKGWILSPKETESSFLQRREITLQRAPFQKTSFHLPLYDICFEEIPVFYSNKSLSLWQGAVLWEYFTEEGHPYPVIQLRKSLEKSCFGTYSEKEILSHELVHMARFAFQEPLFEEVLAYQTSPKILRRFFGPLFIYPIEAVFLAICCLAAPLLSLLAGVLWALGLLFLVGGGLLIRLFLLQGLFYLSRRKIEKMGVSPSNVLPILIRLSDQEIIRAAFCSAQRTRREWILKSQKDPRFQTIIETYF
jgi:hypothetical protein